MLTLRSNVVIALNAMVGGVILNLTILQQHASILTNALSVATFQRKVSGLNNLNPCERKGERMTFDITVPGKPIAKQRPRKGRYGNFYTPSETSHFEDRVAFAYVSKYGTKRFNENVLIKAYIRFYVKGFRADLDNAVKTILDGFKTIFNDRAVKFIKAEIIDIDDTNERTDVTLETYRKQL
jgi:Holliday junction resolvase RusA-like endonuclease